MTPDKRLMGNVPVDDFERLRSLLLAEDVERIDELTSRLDDPTRRSEEVGAVLSQAISGRTERDKDIATALETPIEEALSRSIREDPGRIADAIFPVIGPAIRRAIAQALSGLVQRLNQTVEHSLTWSGIRMRLEAARTGLPFAEVVLRRALLYRVEQVFVIHRETSLLVARAVDEHVATFDPDIVASMLTVLQDFVSDSLRVEQGDTLDTLQVADLSVWIEPGPKAILAAVIRGHAPEDLRRALSELQTDLHRDFGAELDAFDGDTTALDPLKARLADALWSQERSPERRKGPGPAFLAITAALLLVVIGLVGLRVRDGMRLERLVESLDLEPGIEVTSARRADGGFSISGLRDPLAADPLVVAAGMGLDAERLRFRWEPFVAGTPEIVARRLSAALEPPEGAVLTPTETGIAVEGDPPAEWVDRVRERLSLIAPGLSLDASDVEARRTEAIALASARVADSQLQFEWASTDVSDTDQEALTAVLASLDRLVTLGAEPVLVVLAHVDSAGPTAANETLRRQRADRVVEALTLGGWDAERIRVDLVSPNSPEAIGRRVTFRVELPSATAPGRRP